VASGCWLCCAVEVVLSPGCCVTFYLNWNLFRSP
jgi:hypothetical protein